MRKAVLTILAFSALALPAIPAGAQGLGMPNPASTFCVDTGGTLVISDTGSGEVGTCVYDNGLAVDEWSLYRLFSGLSLPTLDW